MYAPLYRQTGLANGMPVAGADSGLAVQDVRDAFAHYLEHDNAGRNFVLLGHSQGTFMLESLIKRDLGVKDMGNILKGHGGVLDRFDALLFSLPAVYYLVELLNLAGA